MRSPSLFPRFGRPRRFLFSSLMNRRPRRRITRSRPAVAAEGLEGRTLLAAQFGFSLALPAGTACAPPMQYGHDVAADAAGNVYGTVMFAETVDFPPAPGTTTNLTSAGRTDAFVAKYDSGGALDWVQSLGGTDVD